MIQRLRNSDIAGNVFWVLVSVLLAMVVWYIAVTSSDPISSRRFQSMPVQIIPSDVTVVTNRPRSFVTVTIQGPQAAVASRRSEDIVVRADLDGLGPGTHTVKLDVQVAEPDGSFRPLVSQSQPSQITVELESKESFQKPVKIKVTDPPIGFSRDEPMTDVSQVWVSGASSIVSEVAAVQGELDLSGSLNPVETDVRLYAVDADGNRVNDVVLELQTVPVSVNITRRDDIRQIPVRLSWAGTPPDGFNLSSLSYEPKSLLIGGAPEQLENIEDTLFTDPIHLENRQSDFEITVPVKLPNEGLSVIGSDNKVTVSIGIEPTLVTRQFDDIEVGAIGLGAGYIAAIVPQSVSAIVNGPVSWVEALFSEDIQVIVDLNGLALGVYDLEPSISINQGELSEANVLLQPAAVNVEIVSSAPQAEATEESA